MDIDLDIPPSTRGRGLGRELERTEPLQHVKKNGLGFQTICNIHVVRREKGIEVYGGGIIISYLYTWLLCFDLSINFIIRPIQYFRW